MILIKSLFLKNVKNGLDFQFVYALTSSLLFTFLLTSCGGGNKVADTSSALPPNPSDLTNGPILTQLTGNNVVSIDVNGAKCTHNVYVNKPCVQVKICAIGSTTNCQIIDDILLDTGSYGLRVFKSVINSTVLAGFTQVTSASKPVGECVQYGDGTAQWGPVQKADVILGGEPAVTVPIHLLDPTFGTPPTACSAPDTTPDAAGLNGILGVGVHVQDCGTTCSGSASNGMYYVCNAATANSPCAGSVVPLVDQVQNPIALLPTDNNGVILQFPSMSYGGGVSLSGYMVLGIGTQSNNSPASNVVSMNLNSSSPILVTEFSGATMYGIIDSGSNLLYFPTPTTANMPDCGTNMTGLYCPFNYTSLSAVNRATATGSTASRSVTFYVGNARTLYNSGNAVFLEMASSLGLIGMGSTFDWGLPFFYGRNVYVGFEGTTQSTLGAGPYWAW